MSGKPAARLGDMTQKGGSIVRGSSGVMIGSPTGVACSVCPVGTTSGNPVNPLLGAKVQPAETDFALPGPLPFILSRTYSSYQTKTPAPVSISGQGWKAPCELRLQIRDDELILNDNGGRSIYFEPLFPGETAFSRSESLWLARGGVIKLHASNALHRLWQTLPEAMRLSPHIYLATNSAQGPWWIFGWAERVPEADEILPAPLPPYRLLTGLADRFGRTLRYQYDAGGEFCGHITAVTDGAGRRFRLVLTTQAQRAEAASKQAKVSGITSPTFPEKMPVSGFGKDSGIRLEAVWLTHDPEHPDNLPSRPLVRYEYTPRGELAAVYDRGGMQTRRFEYDPRHPGRMVAHQHTGRPPVSYLYDADGRVTEQRNPAGLSYTYHYEKNAVTITDSLNRREVLHTEGEAGLKRVVKKEQADGSTLLSKFDNAGRLLAQTGADGRRTEYRLDVASGNVTEMTAPDGRKVRFSYNDLYQLIATTGADGLRSTRTYDDLGRLMTETSRQGDTTRYAYDSPYDDLPCSVEDATGSRKSMVRNRYGQVITFTDCSGYETRHEYDRFGQLTAIHSEEDQHLYLAYDNRGRLVSRKDAQGNETRYEYNPAGDLAAVIRQDGSRSETQYDAGGRPVSLSDGGLTRQMEYDIAGRVTTLINENSATTTFAYDVMDRRTEERGFDGRTQHYGYRLNGQIIRSEDEGLVTLWHYDESDRLTHCTVNGEEAERWQYNEHGRVSDISHLSDGHRITVHYDYDEKGRIRSETQCVYAPQTSTLLWEHSTTHDYQHGLAYKTTSDRLPPVEWLTYGSGYLAGMKLGNTPLVDITRDRLHRETVRCFGAYELASTWNANGQLQRHTPNLPALNREYDYNDSGQLIRVSGPQQQRQYQYDGTGRLYQVALLPENTAQEFFSDPAGNRTADRTQYPMLPAQFPDNRIGEDIRWFYHHDKHGRLTGKDERHIRDGGSHSHHYDYDNRHRLSHYRLTQQGQLLRESRYLCDPLGRRVSKRVWQRQPGHENFHEQEDISQNSAPEVTWYGWDGDRLTTMQTAECRVQTIYAPGTFTPLVRVETALPELAKATRRTLAEKLQQYGQVRFPPELVALLDGLEAELQCGEISEANRQWLAQCGLTPERMQNQLEPVYIPLRKIHLYHCDHRGLPLALIKMDGSAAWCAEYDEWGNVLREDHPDNLMQLIRLPGQQYDKETGLYYNRHRYYDPQQGRYITQDPIGLRGGWNMYLYPLDPVSNIDPRGLMTLFPPEYPNHGLDTPPEGQDGLTYSPDFWNASSTRRSNNCYSYAMNRPYISIDHPLLDNTPSELTCSNIGNILNKSGVKAPDSSGQCPSGYHKISLFIAPEKDFHFYRQEDDGMWTHKRGGDAISDLDALGQKIKAPTSSSRQFKDRLGSIDYSMSCGEYCAKN